MAQRQANREYRKRCKERLLDTPRLITKFTDLKLALAGRQVRDEPLLNEHPPQREILEIEGESTAARNNRVVRERFAFYKYRYEWLEAKIKDLEELILLHDLRIEAAIQAEKTWQSQDN